MLLQQASHQLRRVCKSSCAGKAEVLVLWHGSKHHIKPQTSKTNRKIWIIKPKHLNKSQTRTRTDLKSHAYSRLSSPNELQVSSLLSTNPFSTLKTKAAQKSNLGAFPKINLICWAMAELLMISAAVSIKEQKIEHTGSNHYTSKSFKTAQLTSMKKLFQLLACSGHREI